MSKALAVISGIISGNFNRSYTGRITDVDKLYYSVNRLDTAHKQWIKLQCSVYGLSVNQCRVLSLMAAIHQSNKCGDYYYGGPDGSDKRITQANHKLTDLGLIKREGEYPFTKFVWIG